MPSLRQFLHTLRDRTPLGLLQLKHDRLRLLTAIALFWHFVDVIWIVLFILVYLWPS